MEKEIYTFEGKTTNEAIELGLKTLKVAKKDVEIKVIEAEKKSFFSILAPRIVKVEMKLKEKNNNTYKQNETKEISNESINVAIKNIKCFLDKWVIELPTKDIKYSIEYKNSLINVEFSGDNINYLIGYRGEVMNALQVILTSIAEKNLKERIKVSLDILGYKTKRKEVLEQLADKLANRVIKTRKTITLEPMNAYERKIIHSKLQNNPKVQTVSVGEGKNRRITIELN